MSKTIFKKIGFILLRVISLLLIPILLFFLWGDLLIGTFYQGPYMSHEFGFIIEDDCLYRSNLDKLSKNDIYCLTEYNEYIALHPNASHQEAIDACKYHKAKCIKAAFYVSVWRSFVYFEEKKVDKYVYLYLEKGKAIDPSFYALEGYLILDDTGSDALFGLSWDTIKTCNSYYKQLLHPGQKIKLDFVGRDKDLVQTELMDDYEGYSLENNVLTIGNSFQEVKIKAKVGDTEKIYYLFTGRLS